MIVCVYGHRLSWNPLQGAVLTVSLVIITNQVNHDD